METTPKSEVQMYCSSPNTLFDKYWLSITIYDDPIEDMYGYIVLQSLH